MPSELFWWKNSVQILFELLELVSTQYQTV